MEFNLGQIQIVLMMNLLRGLGADSEVTSDELRQIVDSKIALGETLKKRLETFGSIEGAIKIQRKINQEIKFLAKV